MRGVTLVEQAQRSLLEYLRAALDPEAAAPALPGKEELSALLELAGEQQALLLVLDQLLPILRTVDWAAEMLGPLRQTLLQGVAGQARRTQKLEELCRALDQAGLRVLVLKGLACRRLYPKPDLRPSSDEDLLARDADFAAVDEQLRRAGMEVVAGEMLGQAQVVTYLDRISGLRVELHRRLFPEGDMLYGGMNACFAHAFQKAERLPWPDAPVWSMGPGEHLLYLICHSFKHFVHSGFGVRQVCDLCLSAAAYGADIDWPALFCTLEELHADCFAVNLFAIGSRYLGFAGRWNPAMEAALATRETPDCDALLEDLLAGGVYGSNSTARLHSSRITLNAAARPGHGLGGPLLRTLFPAAAELEGEYPYLKGHHWLVPGAWVQRMARYAAGNQDLSAAARESVSIGERRVALLRKYRVIP